MPSLEEGIKMRIKLAEMSDDDLKATWIALFAMKAEELDTKLYAPGITMYEWSEVVYSFMCLRNLPR
jgi:hypothetical protein